MEETNIQFNKDLAIGKIGESLVKKLFKRDGFKVRSAPDGNFPGYDVEILRDSDKKHFFLEVKFDLQSAVTGNIALEHKALKRSVSTHYVYLLIQPYLISKAALEWFADSPDFIQVPSGDFGDISSLIPLNHEKFKEFKKL